MAEGKMPDAAEWADNICDRLALRGERANPLAIELADFQRETLLWAAQQARIFKYGGASEEVAQALERLAALGEKGSE